jgi:hypothetical protein
MGFDTVISAFFRALLQTVHRKIRKCAGTTSSAKVYTTFTIIRLLHTVFGILSHSVSSKVGTLFRTRNNLLADTPALLCLIPRDSGLTHVLTTPQMHPQMLHEVPGRPLSCTGTVVLGAKLFWPSIPEISGSVKLLFKALPVSNPRSTEYVRHETETETKRG